MENIKVRENLCIYNPLYPYYDKENNQFHKKKSICYCDNCFSGRNELALEILKLQEQKKLLDYATKAVQTLGFTLQTGKRYDYYLTGSKGLVRLSLRADHYGLDLYAMFDDIAKAKAAGINEINPFSGKHNHMCITNIEEIDTFLKDYL